MGKYELTVRRAALPEVLLGPDVAVAVDIPEDAAERAIQTGRFGPAFFLRGRPAVLKETFLRYLADSSHTPARREVLP